MSFHIPNTEDEDSQEENKLETSWKNNWEYVNWLNTRMNKEDDDMMDFLLDAVVSDEVDKVIVSPVKERPETKADLTLIFKKNLDTYRIGTPKKKEVSGEKGALAAVHENSVYLDSPKQLKIVSVETSANDVAKLDKFLSEDGDFEATLEGMKSRILARIGPSLKKIEDSQNQILDDGALLSSEISQYKKSLVVSRESLAKKVEALSSILTP